MSEGRGSDRRNCEAESRGRDRDEELGDVLDCPWPEGENGL
jgi:hypothetical protein